MNNSKKEKNFVKYCLKTLSKELENLSLKNDPNFNCGEEFNNLVENKIQKVMEDLSQQLKVNDSKTLTKISNTLNFIQKNIKNISFYKNSNIKCFFDMLTFQIYNSDAYIMKEFYDYLVHTMEKFESFFRIPPEKRNTLAQKEFYDLFSTTNADLIKLFDSFKCKDTFDSTKDKIIKYLDDQIANAKQLLKTNKNDANLSFSVILEFLINNNINQLSSNLKNELVNLGEKFKEIKNNARVKGKEININNHIECSSFLEDLDKINYDIYIKNHFGIENLLKIKNDEFIDDIIEIHGLINIIKNFFKYLFKGKDEKLKDNLLELKDKIVDIIYNEKIAFDRNYQNMQKEILNEFRKNFQTQYSDLSKINKEDFDKALELFIETKCILVEEKWKEEDLGIQAKEKKDINNEKKTQLVENKIEEKDNKKKVVKKLAQLVKERIKQKDYNKKKYIEYDPDFDFDFGIFILSTFFKFLGLSVYYFFKGMLFLLNFLFK